LEDELRALERENSQLHRKMHNNYSSLMYSVGNATGNQRELVLGRSKLLMSGNKTKESFLQQLEQAIPPR